MDLVKDIDLNEFCITSSAKAKILNKSEISKLYKIEDISGIGVLVKKAKGNKCPRCWKIFESICKRCEDAKNI